MRILVTGTHGQIDNSIKHSPYSKNHEIINIGRPETDLSDFENLAKKIIAIKPDIIISSAAYTMVDKAQSEPELANIINELAPKILAQTAKNLNVPIIHISTDYVFSGDKKEPYIEDDIPNPINIYGETKLAGENAIIQETDNYVILRTSWVYSPYGNNFVKTMLKLGQSKDEINVVNDQIGCPTYAPEIAMACISIAQKLLEDDNPKYRGVFHITGKGSTNWAQFAKYIFDQSVSFGQKPVKINEITTNEYPTPAKRPLNSILSNQKLKNIFDIELNDWKISVAECIKTLLAR